MSIWEETTLGDVLDKIVGGGTPSKSVNEYWNGEICWCSVKDMSIDRFRIDSTEDSITELGLENSSAKLIQKGTVITATRMGLGRAFINQVDMAINQDLKALIPNKKIDKNFLLWTIVNKRAEIDSLGSGATVKGITVDTLKSIRISLPSKNIQIKISSILSAYDDLIENNLKRIKLLEELAQRTYEEWFVKFRVRGEKLKVNKETGLPEGWIKKTLGDMIEVGRGSSPRPIADQRYFEGGNIPWLKIADATASHIFIHKTREHVNDLGASFSRKLKPGSLIVAASGTLGFPMFLSVEACIHDGWIYFSDFNEDLKEYFYFSFIGLKQYFESISYGAAIQNINTGIVKASPFILPPKKILAAFREISRPVLKSIEIAQKENILLKEARDILLPRLMSGVIDVEEFDHEPLAMAAEPVATYQTKHRAKSLTQK